VLDGQHVADEQQQEQACRRLARRHHRREERHRDRAESPDGGLGETDQQGGRDEDEPRCDPVLAQR
jgi:hypothetical protein